MQKMSLSLVIDEDDSEYEVKVTSSIPVVTPVRKSAKPQLPGYMSSPNVSQILDDDEEEDYEEEEVYYFELNL